jgi:citrate lyase subunit beta / citryl-CoA lyase
MPLYRSFLFAPGNHPRRVEKAFTVGADAVILDLEDAVATAEKPAARKAVAAVLAQAHRCRGYARVNAASTEFCYADLVAVVGRGVAGVVLPKVESAADLHAIDWLIASLERERGLAVGSLELIPIIETAIGMHRIDRVVQARGLRPYEGRWRVRRLAFGAADYAAEVGLAPGLDEAELSDARARVVLASRAAGLEGPLDSPWFHLRETDAFARALQRSRRGGFQGRLCIHPDQVQPVNAAYAPSKEEVERAERIVAAFDTAEASGAAAIQVDGQMVDYPVANRARAVIEAAREIDAQRS